MDKDDPNANLFGYDEDDKDTEELAYDQTYGKNPIRVDALGDLIYEDMTKTIEDQEGLTEEGKKQMLFKMTANSILDMMMDAIPSQDGLDMSYSFDMLLGVALTNRRYGVDLFKEHEKALINVKPSEFGSDDAYRLAIQEFEEKWWDIPQPALDERTPNDAIREMLDKYGLSDQ